MNCPNCNSTSRVYDSRVRERSRIWHARHPTPSGYIRRRECLSCQYRWTTIEITLSTYGGLVSRVTEARKRIRKHLLTLDRILEKEPQA